MTDQEFEDAVTALRGDWRKLMKGMSVTLGSVYCAVLDRIVVPGRVGVLAPMPTHAELVEFLDCLDSRQRGILKEAAEREQALMTEDEEEGR